MNNLDRIILGDNQFFGINHMSQEKAAAAAERFATTDKIIRVIDDAYDVGVRGFMFTTHARVAEICDHVRKNPDRYKDIRFYPGLPYAHKYADAVAENGIFGALKDMILGNSAGGLLSIAGNVTKGLLFQNPFDMMKALVDMELKMFNKLDVRVVFLQNIVTDLLLGYRIKEPFVEFAKYVKSRYGAEPGFVTQNLPTLVGFLEECGIENPVVCSGINKIGYLMNPDQKSYEKCIAEKKIRAFAMSILASGAVPPRDAVKYLKDSVPNLHSVVFGASSKNHIADTISLIKQNFPDWE